MSKRVTLAEWEAPAWDGGTVDFSYAARHGVGREDRVKTPFGDQPAGCVYEVPNGAHIHSASGEVTLNGQTIAQLPACDIVSAGSVSDAGYSYDGFNNVFTAYASVSNVTGLLETSVTPQLPSIPDAGQGPLYFWEGLQLSNNDILQPLIAYQTNDYQGVCSNGPGGNKFCYQGNPYFFNGSSNNTLTVSAPIFLSPGDVVNTEVFPESATEWYAYIFDTAAPG